MCFIACNYSAWWRIVLIPYPSNAFCVSSTGIIRASYVDNYHFLHSLLISRCHHPIRLHFPILRQDHCPILVLDRRLRPNRSIIRKRKNEKKMDMHLGLPLLHHIVTNHFSNMFTMNSCLNFMVNAHCVCTPAHTQFNGNCLILSYFLFISDHVLDEWGIEIQNIRIESLKINDPELQKSISNNAIEVSRQVWICII